MKKEWIAAALLLALFFGAWLNIRHIDDLTDGINACLMRSESAMARGDAEEALSALAGAMDLWEKSSGYNGIFLSHHDLNDLYGAFYQLQELLLQKDTAAAPAAYAQLRYYLEDIRSLEHLSLEAVL